MMMEIESGTEISPSPSMQIMTRPATATPATDDDQELEEGNTTSFLRTAETFLRLLPIGLCVSALVLMLKNSQQNDYGSVSYTDFGAFRYLVLANGICAAYSLLSAVLVAVPRPTARRVWTIFFLDQVIRFFHFY
ncbi:hypothetical protein TSUD_123890 [Trifolium subterraneum]|uniref:CASP-like protein n=1 Tax=Trifolium subterraneum TaxID=3900 RepID=A0A2Z6P6I6_TRISU|nr:hypothetical protein TSUD_123890 [Trifolium subterraneum]